MRPLGMPSIQPGIFSKIIQVQLPEMVQCDSIRRKTLPFSITFSADGEIPFPQVILRINGQEYIYNNEKIKILQSNVFTTDIPECDLPVGTCFVQIEGCRKKEWQQSNGDDWVKWFGEFKIEPIVTSDKSAATKSVGTPKKKTP
jgi:hypothetical protein